MTRRRSHVCAEPGCPNLTDAARCDEHAPAHATEQRNNYPRHRYGAAWPRIRAAQLRRHPNCQCTDPACKCGGRCTSIATEVDHVTALRHFTTRRVGHQRSNLQSLCKPCHSSKTARIDSAFVRRVGRRGVG